MKPICPYFIVDRITRAAELYRDVLGFWIGSIFP
jgi:hypothetical protein